MQQTCAGELGCRNVVAVVVVVVVAGPCNLRLADVASPMGAQRARSGEPRHMYNIRVRPCHNNRITAPELELNPDATGYRKSILV
jgi:hypothetical protein